MTHSELRDMLSENLDILADIMEECPELKEAFDKKLKVRQLVEALPVPGNKKDHSLVDTLEMLKVWGVPNSLSIMSAFEDELVSELGIDLDGLLETLANDKE